MPSAGRGDVMVMLADPFTFPSDLLLEHLNEHAPGVPVIGGQASGGLEAGRNVLIAHGEIVRDGAAGVILRGGDRLRWGGDLGRRSLFGSLEARPGTTVVGGFGRADIGAALAPYRRRRWEIWRRGPTIVSTEVLEPGLLDLIRRVGVALAVDIHDEPVLQADALGVTLEGPRIAELRARMAANLSTFRLAIVPSASFRDLAGLDIRRSIIAPN